MRQRAKRDLIAIVGVILVLALVIFVNYNFNRGALAAAKDKERRHWESVRAESGMEILRWRHMRDTTGSLRHGANFTEELMKWNNKQVNLIGFMVPENEFRDIKDFILLPLPIECYFCGRPPVQDVMNIQMEEGKTTMLAEEPVLVNGVLRLHEGPDQKYFYSITQAQVVAAEEGTTLQRRYIEPEHMLPQHNEEVVLEEGIELGGDS